MKFNFYSVIFLLKIALYAINADDVAKSVIDLYTDDKLIKILRPCSAVAIGTDYILSAANCFYFHGNFMIQPKGGVEKTLTTYITHPDFHSNKGSNNTDIFDLVAIKITNEQDVKDLNLHATSIVTKALSPNAKCVITDGTFKLNVAIDHKACKKPELAYALCLRFVKSESGAENASAVEHINRATCKPGTPIFCDDALVGILPYRKDCLAETLNAPNLFKNLDWINFVYNELNDTVIVNQYRDFSGKYLGSVVSQSKVFREENTETKEEDVTSTPILDVTHAATLDTQLETQPSTQSSMQLGTQLVGPVNKVMSKRKAKSKTNKLALPEHLHMLIVCLYVFTI